MCIAFANINLVFGILRNGLIAEIHHSVIFHIASRNPKFTSMLIFVQFGNGQVSYERANDPVNEMLHVITNSRRFHSYRNNHKHIIDTNNDRLGGVA